MSLSVKLNELLQLLKKVYLLGEKVDDVMQEMQAHLELLRKLGTKKAIFNELADKLELYLDADDNAEVSMARFMDTVGLLTEILLGISSTEVSGGKFAVNFFDEKINYRNESWLTLNPIVKAMSVRGSGRLKALEQSYVLKTYQNRQLFPYIIEACGDSYTKISELALKDMLPFFGYGGALALLDSLDTLGGKSEINKLKYLLKVLQGEDLRCLIQRIFEEAEVSFKREALKTCLVEPWMRSHLEDMMASRSSELSSLAKCAFEKLPG